MKSIRSLFMIAIGMMVFTATAHTAKLEQKQKPELVKELLLVANTVSVVNEYQFVLVSTKATIFLNQSVQNFKIENDFLTFYTIITDVGWKVSNQRFSQIPYTEKFLENYDRNFKNQISKDKIPIRSNC